MEVNVHPKQELLLKKTRTLEVFYDQPTYYKRRAHYDYEDDE